MSVPITNVRPDPDQVLVDIVDYVLSYSVDSTLALETARNCLIDTLGCGLEALSYPACTKLMGRSCRAPSSSSTRCRPRSTSAR